MLRSVFNPAVILFVICFVVTMAVAFMYNFTREAIDQRKAVDAQNARRQVLSEADEFIPVENVDVIKQGNKSLDIVKEVYEAVRNGKTIGHVFTVVTKGYGGDMEVTIGVDSEGTITGVKIGSHSETPGLGAKASQEPFITQFTGVKPEGPFTVVKGKSSAPEEIDAISGATITSRAVTNAVQAAYDMSAILKKEN